MSVKKNITNQRKTIQEYIQSIIGDTMHAKRVLSLSNAVEGVMHAASLALSTIGKALAVAQGINTKHAIKQLDRFFSNKKIYLDRFFSHWILFLVGSRKEIIVALDWTDFDSDNHSTLSLNLLTKHGRATPLMWKTYIKNEMTDKRNAYEDIMLYFLQSCLPDDCSVTILADRGFQDTAFFYYLNKLGFNYVIRIKNNITMRVGLISKTTREWLSPSGKARIYKNVYLTKANFPVSAVVCVHDKKMKGAWFLATNLDNSMSKKIINLYSRRFTIEENFRDIKDLRFGMGLSSVKIVKPERRDRILIASAIATSLLSILGAAGEALGFDRLLKSNTVKTRTHSLLTQGAFYFQAMINYTDEKLLNLVNKFTELIDEHLVFKDLFGWV
jgi:hypothetical protein